MLVARFVSRVTPSFLEVLLNPNIDFLYLACKIRSMRMRSLYLALVLLGSIWLTSCSSIPIDRLKEEIEQECPVGSHYSKVIAFLDSRGIQHRPYPKTCAYIGTISATIPEAKRRGLYTWSIHLSFDFDHDCRLTKYFLSESETSDNKIW
jgi:hypothetical protein